MTEIVVGDIASAREHEEEMAKLRDAAKHLGVDSLRDGSWFRRIVTHHAKKHAEHIAADHWDRAYPRFDVEQRAHHQIVRVARAAAAAGAMASLGASTGELLSLLTDGLAAPIGLPATAASMLLEAAYTSLLQIDLACDVASIYGVPFDPDDVGEVATLFALALGVDVKKKKAEDEDDARDRENPHGLTSKLLELEEGDVATRIGRKMLEDSVMKNVLPVVGMAVSARWNYVGTRKLGAAVRKYARYRRALRHALAKLDLSRVKDPAVIVEGAWLLATVDGEASHEEVMAIALVMDHVPHELRAQLTSDATLGEDEEDWFEALARVPKGMHEPLLDVLYLVAATDKELGASEKRFLKRVGKALKRDVALDRVKQICKHLACGDELPDGILP